MSDSRDKPSPRPLFLPTERRDSTLLCTFDIFNIAQNETVNEDETAIRERNEYRGRQAGGEVATAFGDSEKAGIAMRHTSLFGVSKGAYQVPEYTGYYQTSTFSYDCQEPDFGPNTRSFDATAVYPVPGYFELSSNVSSLVTFRGSDSMSAYRRCADTSFRPSGLDALDAKESTDFLDVWESAIADSGANSGAYETLSNTDAGDSTPESPWLRGVGVPILRREAEK